jgi:3'-phosphoadenosine 5'-phosphosulfate sulfotransferase (PAPS reductase)/FAD synthetase
MMEHDLMATLTLPMWPDTKIAPVYQAPRRPDGILQIAVPSVIDRAMQAGAALAISISGGKDSLAMLNTLVTEYRRRDWPGPLYAVHAHLGRAEWPQTLAHCQTVCDRLGVPLVVVSRPQGDLLQEIRDRMEKLRTTGSDAPPWPDAQNRYCTSDQKRTQVDKILRAAPWPDAQNRYCTGHQKTNQLDKALRSSPWPSSSQRYCTADQKRDQIIKAHRDHQLVIAAMGMRAQESTARSKRPVVSVANRVSAKALKGLAPEDALAAIGPGQRLGLDWLPIHEWHEDDVWEACGHSTEDVNRRRKLYGAGDMENAFRGWLAHPAYVMGNQRLSCSICILASKSDIINGARHNPELYQAYVEIEQESGFTFKKGFALADLAEEIAAVPAFAAIAKGVAHGAR